MRVWTLPFLSESGSIQRSCSLGSGNCPFLYLHLQTSGVIFKRLWSSSNVWSKAMFKGLESSSNVWSHLQTSRVIFKRHKTTNGLNRLETSGVIFKHLHFQSSFLPISIFFRNPGQAETELLMRRKEFLDEIHQVPFNTTQNIHENWKCQNPPKETHLSDKREEKDLHFRW